jgi:hypothetical protein
MNRYEDYLDNHVNQTDLYYLEDMALARQLVEFGYVTLTQTLQVNKLSSLILFFFFFFAACLPTHSAHHTVLGNVKDFFTPFLLFILVS